MRKSFLIPAIMVAVLAVTLPGCMTNRHTVGNGPTERAGAAVTYSSAKQVYLFWGLIALGGGSPHVPDQRDYQYKASSNLADAAVAALTLGIVTLRTVKIRVRSDHPALRRN